jgi:aminoglycoside/choline kinase family phosphotransferase
MVLLRRIQALGAYARLAAVKGKTEFLTHVPTTMSTLNALGASGRIWRHCPDLRDWLQRVFETAARDLP